MNVGFVVDGESEFVALPQLRDSLENQIAIRLMKPARIQTTPLAPLSKLAAECRQKAKLLQDRGATLVVVLIDREDREECPPVVANQLREEIAQKGSADLNIDVVVKDRTFENWVVADPGAISAFGGLFSADGAASIARAVKQSGADHVDAPQLLARATSGRRYSKVRDSKQILARADIRVMGRNSRSFRCLLRRLGHPDYQNGSRRPAAE